MAETMLDAAHAAMQADVNDDAARLHFYEKLVGSELFLLLESEPEGDRISRPMLFDLPPMNRFVLVFDTRRHACRNSSAAWRLMRRLSGRTVIASTAGRAGDRAWR